MHLNMWSIIEQTVKGLETETEQISEHRIWKPLLDRRLSKISTIRNKKTSQFFFTKK
jgi:hypothetical protein